MASEDIDSNLKEQPQSLGTAWYMVVLCMIAYLFSFVDRQIVALLIEPIRADLHISDTQFSLIHGLAFAIFYAVMGLPIARLADTKSRPVIIAIGIAVWSIATAVCGTAKSFFQLFAARMAVGVGEAALSPAAYSMITDAFPKSKLGVALGVYSMGSFLGAGLAYIIGGVAIEMVTKIGIVEMPIIGTVKPWQMTFFIVGLPGLLIAALFFLTVKDPERKGVVQGDSGYSIGEVFAYIGQNKGSFTAHYVGFGLLALVLYALMSWAPAFFLRNFELTTREVGLYLGTLVLVCNVGGVLTSGWLIDFFTKRGRTDAALIAAIVGGVGALIPAALFPFMPNLTTTLIVLGVALYFASFPMATSAAALQWMAPNQMRAQVTALFFLFMNLFGITGGSSLVALSTDYLFKDEQLVGYSMAIVACAAALIAVVLMARGLAAFRKTVSDLQQA
ncbi:MAG: MFS transporter [Pseudomonadales bacterium]|nr:MFS transporter [Pseudomonadales bacterium]MCP5214389.1 MFS transporter [Pseudomonadales bacterium]MCP5303320.1 MFS transporter [Pseudomonadales bacterium]